MGNEVGLVWDDGGEKRGRGPRGELRGRKRVFLKPRPLLVSSPSFSLPPFALNLKKKLPGNGPLRLPDRRVRRPRLHPPPRQRDRLAQRRLRGLDRPPPLLGVCALPRGAEVGRQVRRRGAPVAQRAEGQGESGRGGDRGAEGGEGREEGGGV